MVRRNQCSAGHISKAGHNNIIIRISNQNHVVHQISKHFYKIAIHAGLVIMYMEYVFVVSMLAEQLHVYMYTYVSM